MHKQIEGERLIRIREVCATVGLMKSKIYDMSAKGEFPPRIQLSPRAVVWQASAVQAWIAEQIAKAEAKAKAEG